MEFEKKLFPEGYIYRPSFVIRRFTSFLSRYGIATVMDKRVFQLAREMWVTATYALALSSVDKREYWVIPLHENSSPDTKICFFSESKEKGGNIQSILNIEITEWFQKEFTNEGLIDVIEKKIKKSYPEYFTLVVYAKRPGEMIDLESTFRALGERDIKLLNIWLLSSVDGQNNYDHALISLHRERSQIMFNLVEQIDRDTKEPVAMKTVKGFGHDTWLISKDFRLELPDLPKTV